MKSIRILWNYMAHNRLLYLGAILSVALASLARISTPLVIRITIDNIIGGQPLAAPLLIRSFVENIGQALQKICAIGFMTIFSIFLTSIIRKQTPEI